jgi:hypothetical protein
MTARTWQRILDPLSPIFVAERTRITVHLTVALGPLVGIAQ